VLNHPNSPRIAPDPEIAQYQVRPCAPPPAANEIRVLVSRLRLSADRRALTVAIQQLTLCYTFFTKHPPAPVDKPKGIKGLA